MINQYLSHNKQYHAAQHLRLAYSVLRSSFEKVQQVLQEDEIIIIDFRHGEESEKYIKMWLGPVWLLCYFDESDRCKRSSLLFDDAGDISDYIDCCKEAYSYNYLSREWTARDYSIHILDIDKGYNLIFVAA